MTDLRETIAKGRQRPLELTLGDLTALLTAAEASLTARNAALEEAAALADNPYQDAVAAFVFEEPFAVGKKIAAAIRALGRPA